MTIWTTGPFKRAKIRGVLRYPGRRGYVFAVWAVVWKVASADNRSNPSRNLDEQIKKTFFSLFLTGLQGVSKVGSDFLLA